MNPYRTGFDPGDPTPPPRWYKRRVPNWVSALVIGLAVVTGGVHAATPALRLNGLKFGPNDSSLYGTAFAMVGDGSTDNGTPFANAVAAVPSGATLYVPAGTYSFSSTFNWTYSNVKVVGIGAVTFTTAQQELINFTSSGTISNVTFQNIKFASTYTAVATPIFGVITAFSQAGTDFAMSNIQFIDCEFTGGGSEGVKLIGQSPTNKTFADILFLRDNFHDLGGFGIETQNHVADTTARLVNVVTRDSTFKNIGTYNSYGVVNGGVGVSYSGTSNNMAVDACTFDNCSGQAIEYTNGAGGTITNNRFKGFQIHNGAPYIGIGIDNNSTTTLTAMAIIGNQELEAPPSPAPTWNLYYLVNSVIANNVTQSSGISNKSVTGSLFTGNMIKSIDGFGLYFQTSSTGNKIVGNVIDISGSASPTAVVQFDGATVTNNEAVDNDIIFSGGVGFSQINGAAGNYYGPNRTNNSYLYNNPIKFAPNGTGLQSSGGSGKVFTDDVTGSEVAFSSNAIIVNGTNTTITGPLVCSGGNVTAAASSSFNVDWSNTSGLFKTPTGANTFGGSSNTFSNPLKFSSTGMGLQSGGNSGKVFTDDTNGTEAIFGSNGIIVNSSGTNVQGGFLKLSSVAFASLGTPSNGAMYYCSDCTIANPCAGSGTGALAKRINSTWICN